MSAQTARFLIGVMALALAGWTWYALSGSWMAWVAVVVVFIIGGVAADAVFRRLATQDDIRALYLGCPVSQHQPC